MSASRSEVNSPLAIPSASIACSIVSGSPSTSTRTSIRGYVSNRIVAPPNSYCAICLSTSIVITKPRLREDLLERRKIAH